MNIIKTLYYKTLSVLPARLSLHIEHMRGYKKILNLKNPKYFGEKIQWMKLYGGLEKYHMYVDKYEVRKHISAKADDKYLTDLIGVYNNSDEIDFGRLPQKFVIKGTHGCGYNIICRDKSVLDEQKTKRQLDKWLREDFSIIKKEPQYSRVKPRLIIEQYLDNGPGGLVDYKVFCFNGIPHFIQVIRDRESGTTHNFYDTNWNKLNLQKGKYLSSIEAILKPNCLNELLTVARTLAEGFPFVRVDFYIVQDKIFFGELTFTPAGGLSPFKPIEKDLEIGALIDLEAYNH